MGPGIADGAAPAVRSIVGGADPTSNIVTNNFVHGNLSTDLKYDGTGSGNTFPGNDCGTSHPAGLC